MNLRWVNGAMGEFMWVMSEFGQATSCKGRALERELARAREGMRLVAGRGDLMGSDGGGGNVEGASGGGGD